MLNAIVSVSRQTLLLTLDTGSVVSYPVSTSAYGIGQIKNSYQTPLGKHYIRAKIGAGLPCYAVFKARRPTGEVYNPALAAELPTRDWILTRILWLCGTEIGHNRRGICDTMQRYIYIHGCPDTEPMGIPKSHGCIRMRNQDLIAFFDQVSVGTSVTIVAD